VCIALQSLKNCWYSTLAEQTPAFYAKENENNVFVILTISSFYSEACRNAVRISGIKDIGNFMILLLYPHCPSNTKSCLFPEKEKALKTV